MCKAQIFFMKDMKFSEIGQANTGKYREVKILYNNNQWDVTVIKSQPALARSPRKLGRNSDSST